MKRRPQPARPADLPAKRPLPGPPLPDTLVKWRERGGHQVDAFAPQKPAQELAEDPRLPPEPDPPEPPDEILDLAATLAAFITSEEPAIIEHPKRNLSGTDDTIRLCIACRSRSTFKIDAICTYCAAKGVEPEDKPKQEGGDR